MQKFERRLFYHCIYFCLVINTSQWPIFCRRSGIWEPDNQFYMALCTVWLYIEINTWPFTYQPWYHPKTQNQNFLSSLKMRYLKLYLLFTFSFRLNLSLETMWYQRKLYVFYMKNVLFLLLLLLVHSKYVLI